MEILEIGCGIHPRADATVRIDKVAVPGADIVQDVAKDGIPLGDNTCSKVFALGMLEHIEHYNELIFLINEIWRVLTNGGEFEFTVPHSLDGFKHMTHHRIFYPESFLYLRAGHSPEYDHMRRSDGIVANFELGFIDDPTFLHGRFRARK